MAMSMPMNGSATRRTRGIMIPSTLWTYRHIVSRDQHPSVWVAAWFAGMTLVAMALVPPLRLAPATTAAAFDDAPLIAHRDAPATHAPLLVVGIDSGNWRSLDPLLAAGRLPTLAGLIERGSRGVIEAQWPPYWSSPAWAAMMTGYSIDEHGWHGDLAVDAWGLPPFDAPQERTDLLPIQAAEWFLALHNVIRFVPPARSTLHRPLVWERLRRANVDSGVLRFDFTYPAEGQARYVISNHFGLDTWALALSAPESNPLAATAAARDAGLEAPFRTAFDHAEFATILPTQSRQPPDLHLDPFPVLRVAYKCDRDTLDAAAQLVRSVPTLPVSFVYLGGFDAVCHHFWQYRHPEDYGTNAPAAEDIAALGQVVDRFLEFLDRGLGQVLASYTAPPNVLIVSDHGHGPVFDHPTFRGWHEPHGVFIAAGPDIRHRAEPVPFSYYDVTPTILDLLGYDPPPDLRGWPLRKLLADDPLTTAARSPR